MATAVAGIFADRTTPAEAQDLAHEKDLKHVLAKVRDALHELRPLVEAYGEIQYALDALAHARPQLLRCPYPKAESPEQLIRVALDPMLKRSSAVVVTR